ncbi:MAG: DUF3108 domain-containing protein [Mangrovibacterium sp.]
MRYSLLITLMLCSQLATAQVREKITYGAKFAFVKGGEAELIVSDTLYQGKELTHYYVRGYSTGMTKLIYNVNDIYESILDGENITPYFHTRNASENRYRFYNETTFYSAGDSICSTKSGCRAVPSGLIDALSLYAMIRHQDFFDTLQVGEQFTHAIYHADKHFQMVSTFEGRKTINTKIGTKECFVIAPVIDDSKLVTGSDALKLYITADADRIPVIIELEMTFGKVSGYIMTYEKM